MALNKRKLLEEQIEILSKNKVKNSQKLEELQKQLEKSKRGKSSRTKGANYERDVAKIFKDRTGIQLVRTPQSGGFAKNSTKADAFRGDITTLDDTIEFLLHIECKNHKTISILKWLSQAEDDCPNGKIPTVVFHKRQQNEDGKRVQSSDDYICLRLSDFLNLVPKENMVMQSVLKKKSKLKPKE